MSDETAKNTEGTNHGAEPDYSEHFALTAKGKGCSGKLYGSPRGMNTSEVIYRLPLFV